MARKAGLNEAQLRQADELAANTLMSANP